MYLPLYKHYSIHTYSSFKHRVFSSTFVSQSEQLLWNFLVPILSIAIGWQTFPKIPDHCRALQWWNLRVTITFIISFNIYNMIFKDLFQHPCVSIHQTMHIYVVITSIIYFQFNNGRIWLDVLFHESTHWILNIGCVWDIRFWLTAWTVLNKLVGLCFRNVSLCLKIVTYNIYHSPKYIIHYIKYG